MNDKDLQDWLDAHGGELSRENNEKTYQQTNQYGEKVGEPVTKIDSTTITAKDRSKITIRRNPGSEKPRPEYGMPYEESPESAATRSTYERVGTEPPPQTAEDRRSPEERAVDTDKAAVSAEQRREAEWNRDNGPTAQNPNAPGSGFYETHQERAIREQRAAEAVRAEQQLQLSRESGQRAEEQQARQTAADERQAEQQREANALRERELTEAERAHRAAEKGRPSVLGSPSDTTRSVAVFDPNTGAITATENPAYDAIKADAETRRQEIMLQLESGKLTLQQANAEYTRWFDTNVKLPFQQADEARSQAADARAALDSEERRRQFAASFGLQKADLGERAGQHAAENEISLLPYRAGPTEAADMSSAINSLAVGGDIGGPSPSAGVHFQASDFQFARPDFKKIAAEATKQAIGHLTPYRPAEGSYPTASYGGISFPNAGTAASAPAVPAVSIPYTPPARTATPAPIPATP